MSVGVNRETGKVLSDWPHVEQSLLTIFSTRIGERVMRRVFGSAVPGSLGKNLTPSTILRFYIAFVVAVELWEPRFRVRKISHPSTSNGAALLRQGKFGFSIEGDYRPRALEGDFTVASTRSVAA
jgi:phage baseplate assembly protein W